MTTVKVPVATHAARGYPGFVGWLAKVHPDVYNRVIATIPDTVSALRTIHSNGSVLHGDDPAASTRTQQFIAAVTSAATAILPIVQQQKLLKIQLERARAGQPPLDVGAYVDPNQGVNVGLNPGTQKTLLWLGGGIVGAWLLSRLLGRRGRR